MKMRDEDNEFLIDNKRLCKFIWLIKNIFLIVFVMKV